jgi:hypothetical protein
MQPQKTRRTAIREQLKFLHPEWDADTLDFFVDRILAEGKVGGDGKTEIAIGTTGTY